MPQDDLADKLQGSIDLVEYQRYQSRELQNRRFPPNFIAKIARTNPAVNTAYTQWIKGYYNSWDECLIHIICMLSDMNEKLMKTSMSYDILKPSTITIPKEIPLSEFQQSSSQPSQHQSTPQPGDTEQ